VETLSNAAKVFILKLLIFTSESLEAARGLDEIRKSTPAGANKVSIPQYHGRAAQDGYHLLALIPSLQAFPTLVMGTATKKQNHAF
jgi:hypothetical protein